MMNEHGVIPSGLKKTNFWILVGLTSYPALCRPFGTLFVSLRRFENFSIANSIGTKIIEGTSSHHLTNQQNFIHIFTNQNKLLQEEIIHKTKFNSALPLIIIVRNAIFGKTKPDGYTRATFYINSIIWFTFLIWHLLSYFAFSLRDLIFEEKNIDVISLITSRGEELGFEATDFLNHILELHLFSVIAWGIMFLGLVLLWRKSRWAIYTILISFASYYALLILFMSLAYFNQDVTHFDKVLLSFMGINLLIYFIINRWRTKRELAFLEKLKENQED